MEKEEVGDEIFEWCLSENDEVCDEFVPRGVRVV